MNKLKYIILGQMQKVRIISFYLYQVSRKGKTIATEGRLVVGWGLG